jgi:hypothetical protein
MKQKVLLILFLGVLIKSYSQYNNKNLKAHFDEKAFELTIPKTWKSIVSTYPYYFVKEFMYKDSIYNGYLKISQYKIENLKKGKLTTIVNKRLKELKKARYKKFQYSIENKDVNNHIKLNTSWRSWKDKRQILKHSSEFLKYGNELYVFKYSDSTNSPQIFNKDVNKIISSFKKKRFITNKPYLRKFMKLNFQLMFISNWDVTKIKNSTWYNSIVFFKKGKNTGAASYIESPIFSIEANYFQLKKEATLKELESLILKQDKSLRNSLTLKSRVAKDFIEIDGVWKDYQKIRRRKTIRYFKHNKSIIKAIYNVKVKEYEDYIKEKNLFFGSIKFNN